MFVYIRWIYNKKEKEIIQLYKIENNKYKSSVKLWVIREFLFIYFFNFSILRFDVIIKVEVMNL